MTVVTRWWWIRHAPVPDGSGMCYGQMDLTADCSDRASFEALARHLPKEAVLVTSDLSRTVETAAAIRAAGLALPEPVREPALREQSFGAWQGLSNEEFAALRAFAAHPHWRAPAFVRAPEGESFADLLARVAPAVERLTAEYAGRDIVAVAHGGTIRAAVALALGLDPERALAFTTANLGLTRLDYLAFDAGAVWRVVTINQRVA